MGLFQRLFPSSRAVPFLLSDGPVRSPWSADTLAKIVLADVAGIRPAAVGRSDCMRVPAVVKGRGLICGTLSRLPLIQRGADGSTPTPPRWLTSTNTGQSPRSRMLWTLDDLLFHGTSLWIVQRDPETTEILDALRVPYESWSIDKDTLVISVLDAPAPADEVVLFEGPQEGLITLAAEDVRAARSMVNAWAQRVESPVPLVELHNTDVNLVLDPDEVQELVDTWDDARRNGGTSFTPAYIETKIHGETATDLYTEGRNASRLDFANYLNIPAALLDGSPNEASLTYSTQEGRRNDFVDQTLAYWGSPIEARLSLDDVTPEGTSIAFDFSSLATSVQPSTTPAMED